MVNRVKSRAAYCRSIAAFDLSHSERAVALLWFYRQTQQFEERTASELADDLREEGFPRPHTTRLDNTLRKSRFTVRGRRVKTFQLDLRRMADLDAKYQPVLGVADAKVEGAILPPEWFQGNRFYLEKLCHQINGAYEYGFYDASAALARRMMESLIIEVYISAGLQHEIRPGGKFLMLEGLMTHIRSHKTILLGRNSPKTMDAIKQLGDTAAHDRTYITTARDIDDNKAAYRRLIQELLSLSGLMK
jgi:hypothetical protein